MKLIGNIFFYPGAGISSNSYIVSDEICVLIDPGYGPFLDRLVSSLIEDGFDVKDLDLIVNTHAHIDHCGASQRLKELSGARIALHRLEEKFLHAGAREVSLIFGVEPPEFKVDTLLADELSTGAANFRVLHTPGHTPGSISLYSEEHRALICGDLLFEYGVGRTDLPGGDTEALRKSIEETSRLDIDFLLLGHGNIVKGKDAVRHNFECVKNFF